MIIPNYIPGPVVDEKGHFTPAWGLLMQQFLTSMQQNLSQEGIVLPQQPTANITTLSTPAYAGTILYNASTHQGMINLNGTYKTITTS